MIDDLGNRMKSFYEDRTRHLLPRRTYTVIRLDGKAFHTFTKSFDRPFDNGLINIMDQAAKALCKEVQGVNLAYVQSDEISLVLTDFSDIKTDAWFDGNLQKIASISASITTAEFNRYYLQHLIDVNPLADKVSILSTCKLARFDSRVFTIPEKHEVINYLIWRQKDASRNSISMVAQSLYSHKELHGKTSNQMQEMIFQKGINWDEYDPKLKRGRVIVKETYMKEDVARSRWAVEAPPIFTQDKEFLNNIIK